MAAWRYEISLLVLKNISLVRCAHSWNIFQHSKRNFVSPRGHVISSIYLPFRSEENCCKNYHSSDLLHKCEVGSSISTGQYEKLFMNECKTLRAADFWAETDTKYSISSILGSRWETRYLREMSAVLIPFDTLHAGHSLEILKTVLVSKTYVFPFVYVLLYCAWSKYHSPVTYCGLGGSLLPWRRLKYLACLPLIVFLVSRW